MNKKPLKIIYEDKDVIVIDKLAGVLVHPLYEKQDDTIVNSLLFYYPKIKDVGEDPLRPGIVHRLDKDTSGLLIIAKDNPAFDFLKEQFIKRTIEKRYWALVIDKVKDKTGIITKSISIHKKGYKKRSALLDSKSKKAVTRYKIIKKFKKYTLLEIKTETGRTHQIRVHLASIGHPIVGDKDYKFKRRPCPKDLKRQFLHAYYLKFQLPSGRMIKLKSELPEDLKEILKNII